MPAKRPYASTRRIVLLSFLVSFFVLAASLVIQWLVYDDWLWHTGPLRIVGTTIAAVVTFGFMLHWQFAERQRQQEMVRRLSLVLEMNDRIRNALQKITCLTYISQPEATDSVRQAVQSIDVVLREVLEDAQIPSQHSPKNSTAFQSKASQKSA